MKLLCHILLRFLCTFYILDYILLVFAQLGIYQTTFPSICNHSKYLGSGFTLESLQGFTYQMPAEILAMYSEDPLSSVLEFTRYWRSRYYKPLSERNTANQVCNRVSLDVYDREFRIDSLERDFRAQIDHVIDVAHTLSTLFQNSHSDRLDSLYNDAFYYLTARSAIKNNPELLGFGIAFAYEAYQIVPQRMSDSEPIDYLQAEYQQFGPRMMQSNVRSIFYPYAYRPPENKSLVHVLDMSRRIQYNNTVLTHTYSWFVKHLCANYSYLWARAARLASASELLEPEPQPYVLSTPVVSASRAEGFWSIPYFDCRGTYQWKLVYSVPFFNSTSLMYADFNVSFACDFVYHTWQIYTVINLFSKDACVSNRHTNTFPCSLVIDIYFSHKHACIKTF